MITATEPSASPKTCKKTPCIFKLLCFFFSPVFDLSVDCSVEGVEEFKSTDEAGNAGDMIAERCIEDPFSKHMPSSAKERKSWLSIFWSSLLFTSVNTNSLPSSSCSSVSCLWTWWWWPWPCSTQTALSQDHCKAELHDWIISEVI